MTDDHVHDATDYRLDAERHQEILAEHKEQIWLMTDMDYAEAEVIHDIIEDLETTVARLRRELWQAKGRAGGAALHPSPPHRPTP